MTLNGSLASTARGLAAERARMDVISVNLANANSMTTPTSEAFRRRVAILEGTEDGPRIARIIADPSDLRQVNDPTSPFADARGNVYYSNVQPIKEMVDMMSAQRSYEANIAAFNAAKGMNQSALNIGRA
jgi:flagellar basal-body rod protein FlgC